MYDEQTNSEFLHGLAERLMHVPARYGIDQGDIERLLLIASNTQPDEPLPPVVDGGRL